MSDHQHEAGGTDLRIERLLPASAPDVFDAWIDPATMALWFSPGGRAEVQADVRVGGSFRIVMLGEGMRIEHSGEYLLIDPPRQLVFTWRSAYTGEQPSIVRVVLTPRGDETHLVLTHEQLPKENVASHEGGWGSILDSLAAVLGAVDAIVGSTTIGDESVSGETP